MDDWVTGIRDVTPLAHAIRRTVADGDLEAARELLPAERVYPLPAEAADRVGPR